MKNLKVILLALFWIGGSAVAMAQNSSVYEKYNEMKNVSSVYISKTMLEMDPNLYTNDLYIGKVAGQLDAVYILSTMMGDIRKNMKKDIDDYIKKGKYELLMKQQGVVSGSSFYMKRKGDRVRELIMVTDGSAKLSFVHLVGSMTLEDIQRITRQSQTALLHAPAIEEIRSCISNIDVEKIKREFQGLDIEKIKNEFSQIKADEEIYKQLKEVKKQLGEIDFRKLLEGINLTWTEHVAI